jgi:hypothetical protein
MGRYHGGFYPPQDMNKFRKELKSMSMSLPNSGIIASEVQFKFENNGFKTNVVSYNCKTEMEQIVWIKASEDLFYVIDCARFYYGLPSEPWYHIEESETLGGALKKMVVNFREQTRHSTSFDRSSWRCLSLDENDNLPKEFETQMLQ